MVTATQTNEIEQITYNFFDRLRSIVAGYPDVDFDAILDRGHLNLADISQRKIRLTHDDIIFVLSQLNDPDTIPGIVLLYGCSLEVSDLGILAYAIASSRNLKQALDVMVRFNRLTTRSFDLAMLEASDRACIRHGIRPAYLRHQVEIAEESVTGIWNVFTKLLPESTDFTALELHFSFPSPSYAVRYEEIFRCPVFFEQAETALWFPRDWLELSLENADDTLARLAQGLCEEILASLGPSVAVIENVREALLSRPQSHLMSLQETADALFTSPRSLARHLAEAGSSFREISGEIRMQLARQYLQRSTLPPKQIAHLLGYSQPAAFYRAFKKWHDRTPSQCRNQRDFR